MSVMSFRQGIIPTRMGTSPMKRLRLVLPWDHPHAYGDKLPFVVVVLSDIGSSPRVWGQEKVIILFSDCGRIIPTRMGTRRFFKNRKSFEKDHPHAYGDKFIYNQLHSHILGSSPRVWGQVGDYVNISIITRIIPTRMGTRERD